MRSEMHRAAQGSLPQICHCRAGLHWTVSARPQEEARGQEWIRLKTLHLHSSSKMGPRLAVLMTLVSSFFEGIKNWESRSGTRSKDSVEIRQS